jgi:hypothetical protein
MEGKSNFVLRFFINGAFSLIIIYLASQIGNIQTQSLN